MGHVGEPVGRVTPERRRESLALHYESRDGLANQTLEIDYRDVADLLEAVARNNPKPPPLWEN